MDLTKGLLEKTFSNRLVKYENIKEHNFFKSINFEELENLNLTSPYKPKLKKLNTNKSKSTPISEVITYMIQNSREVDIPKKFRLAKDWDDYYAL